MILNSAPINHGSVNSVARWILSLQMQGSLYVNANSTNYLRSSFVGTVSNFDTSQLSYVSPTLRLDSVPASSSISSAGIYKLFAKYSSLNNSVSVSSTGNSYYYTAYNPTTSSLSIRNTSYLSPTNYFAGTPSRFNVSSLNSKYILEARMASNASINTASYDSKMFLKTFFRSLENTVGLDYTVSSNFFTNFHGIPSSFSIDESSKVYLAMFMDGISVIGSATSLAKEYQVVTLADTIHDEKSYSVQPFELNYYPEHVIIDFYSITDSVDIKV